MGGVRLLQPAGDTDQLLTVRLCGSPGAVSADKRQPSGTTESSFWSPRVPVCQTRLRTLSASCPLLPAQLCLLAPACSLLPTDPSPSDHLTLVWFPSILVSKLAWWATVQQRRSPLGRVWMLGGPSDPALLHTQPVKGCLCVRPNLGLGRCGRGVGSYTPVVPVGAVGAACPQRG